MTHISGPRTDISAGTYVVAVSGGIDSMVLLDMLAHTRGSTFVVAHFDHGIRADSDEDLQLVERVAARYGLSFCFARGNLGPEASEATAREARYAFLHRIKKEQGATAIITAHHQDDMLETAILNVLRGTGRKGLSSLQSGGDVLRPLLHITKEGIRQYAAARPDIVWREDSTNSDERYLRNYIRRQLISNLGETSRSLLLEYVTRAAEANPLIDQLLLAQIHEHSSDGGLARGWFIGLPYDVSCEVMAAWLRARDIRAFDRRLIGRLVVAAKTARAGKRFDIDAGYLLEVGRRRLQLLPRTTS